MIPSPGTAQECEVREREMQVARIMALVIAIGGVDSEVTEVKDQIEMMNGSE